MLTKLPLKRKLKERQKPFVNKAFFKKTFHTLFWNVSGDDTERIWAYQFLAKTKTNAAGGLGEVVPEPLGELFRRMPWWRHGCKTPKQLLCLKLSKTSFYGEYKVQNTSNHSVNFKQCYTYIFYKYFTYIVCEIGSKKSMSSYLFISQINVNI